MYINFQVYTLCILEDINAQTGVTASGTPDIMGSRGEKVEIFSIKRMILGQDQLASMLIIIYKKHADNTQVKIIIKFKELTA